MRTRVIVRSGAIAGIALLASAAPAMAEESTGEVKIDHAAEECIHLLEAGNPVDACQKAPNPILPATNELVIGGLAFLILLVAMYKFAFPAIQNGMNARTQKIRDNLDEAERTKSEASRILEDYQRQLADAKSESARIIDEARQTAEQMRRDLMVRAEAEVTELRDRTRSEIDAAQQRAVADLRDQVSQLAIGAAEVVVQKNLDRDTNRALVERYIEQVGTNA